ncbi:helix-turn-helix domain-containing protein [Panacibacter ginsenosidivorans]|uniref:Helix-turn-helix domain-containing protein n=1 Tax=Panacibacter ginsenosidivorans TaxID=1813871 RepID=A0A5B8V8T8_9BACT|nr:XRE family transcriptional regulator [Panacibacter ginsenosidivorans]QEC67126.1 helix-turn-helix domain-containing protein [Panacibacter ginsenosidivorans]
MSNDLILQISNRIKEKRKGKKITLQQLAEEVGVTKGLISQIENNRTVPSLTVLLSIIKSLHVDLNDFFDKLDTTEPNEPLIIKASAQQSIEKEYTKGSFYYRITSFKLHGKLVDVVLYRQEKDARKGYVSTQAHEFDYMIKGKMQYTIDGKKYILETGDSFYYNARKQHHTKCLSNEPYEMLVIYFFDEE